MKIRQFWLHPVALVLAGGTIMGLALGIRHVQGLFLVPITGDHGWTRETFAFAIAVQNLVWGIAQPFTGMIADRFGSVRVIVAGIAFYALGLVLMAQAATPLAFTLSAGICIGIALSGTAFGAIYGALSRIVPPARRSWALGLAGAVGGVGQFAMVPLAQGLLSTIGWFATLIVLGGAVAALLPLALPLRDRQAPVAVAASQQTLRHALGEAFSHRGFWLLTAGFLTCGFQLAFIASHLPAYLLDHGLAANHGMASLAIIALTNIFGTYLCGHLGGLFRRKYLLAGIYLARSGAMALFFLLPVTPLSVYAFSAAMGLVWLGTVPLTTGLVSQVFGVRYVSTLFGFVFFGHQVGSFLGVWLGGYIFDATRSYDLMWTLGVGLGVLAAALHWPIDDRELARPGLAAA